MNEEQEKQQVIAEIVRKFETHHAEYYKFNEAQLNFVKLFGEAPMDTYEKTKHTWVETDRPDCFLNLLVAANGIGKTDDECLMNLQMAGIINNPYFYDPTTGKLYPFYNKYPTNWRGRIISTPAAIKDTIVPRLIELSPEGTYTREKRGKEYYSYFKGPRGAFDLMTYEQSIDEFESITLNTVSFDEPDRTSDIFLASTSRARKGMKVAFYLTPLGKAAWLHDIAIGNTKWTSGSVIALMEVNCRQHSARGALEHDDLEQMTAGWSEEEREARVYARWTHLSGQVYWMWDEQVHVVDPSEIPRQGTIYMTMDPHTARPNFMQWWKACANGRMYCIKEWPEVVSHETTRGGRPHTIYTYFDDIKRSKYTFEQYCDIIRKVENEIGVADERVMDGRFGNTPYGDGSKPYYEEFCDRGVDFTLSANDPYLYRGHNRVKAGLAHQNALGKTDEETKLPRIFISSNCKNTIRGFTRYIFDPDKKGDSEAVREDGKDEMDCVRYMSDKDDWRYHDPDLMKKVNSMFATKNPQAPGAGI